MMLPITSEDTANAEKFLDHIKKNLVENSIEIPNDIKLIVVTGMIGSDGKIFKNLYGYCIALELRCILNVDGAEIVCEIPVHNVDYENSTINYFDLVEVKSKIKEIKINKQKYLDNYSKRQKAYKIIRKGQNQSKNLIREIIGSDKGHLGFTTDTENDLIIKDFVLFPIEVQQVILKFIKKSRKI